MEEIKTAQEYFRMAFDLEGHYAEPVLITRDKANQDHTFVSFALA